MKEAPVDGQRSVVAHRHSAEHFSSAFVGSLVSGQRIDPTPPLRSAGVPAEQNRYPFICFNYPLRPTFGHELLRQVLGLAAKFIEGAPNA